MPGSKAAASAVVLLLAAAAVLGAEPTRTTIPTKYTGLSSTYVKPHYPYTWEERAYLAPHEPIRMALIEVHGLLAHLDGQAWKTTVFCDWYASFHGIIHHHHDAEEKILFPWMATKGDIPESMTPSHAEMLGRLNQLDETCAAHKSANTDHASQVLVADSIKKQWEELVIMMLPHLQEEERVFIPMFSLFTEEESDAKVDEIVANLGVDGNSKFLPLIYHALQFWGGPNEYAYFELVIPAPIKVMLKHFWSPDFEASWARLHSLETGVEIPAVKLTWEFRFGAVLAVVFLVVWKIVSMVVCGSKANPANTSKPAPKAALKPKPKKSD